MSMTINPIILGDSNELKLNLFLEAKEAVISSHFLMLYAQIEDPASPGKYESFTCTVKTNKDKFFTDDSRLWLMSYNGQETLKAGSENVGENTYLKLNEFD